MRFGRLANAALSAGNVVSKTLSPLIIHLIELEISRQFLGKLECVNWSKPEAGPNPVILRPTGGV
jgi:hypothetical protein